MNKKYTQTKEAAQKLGVSADVLKDRVDSKEFIHGTHYIDIRGAGSPKPVYMWDIEAIIEYWKIPPEHRGNIKQDGRSSRRALKMIG